MLTKPRTVCFCQPVASTISARVTPLARFIIAMTSAFLFVRSAADLAAAFLASLALFVGLAFFVLFAFFAGFAPLAFFGLVSGWLGFASAAGVFSASGVTFDMLGFSFAANCLAVVTLITPVPGTCKAI